MGSYSSKLVSINEETDANETFRPMLMVPNVGLRLFDFGAGERTGERGDGRVVVDMMEKRDLRTHQFSIFYRLVFDNITRNGASGHG